MYPLQFVGPVGAVLDLLAPFAVYLVFVLVLANMATRFLAHRVHVRAANDDDEALTRYGPHTATTVLLVLASFLYTAVHQHGGIVMSTLVLGLFISDFFEFESRRVEARNAMDLERPKGSLVASVILLLYAAYQALFFLIADYWNAVI